MATWYTGYGGTAEIGGAALAVMSWSISPTYYEPRSLPEDGPAPHSRNSRVIWTYTHGYHLNQIMGGYYPTKLSKLLPPIRPRVGYSNRISAYSSTLRRNGKAIVGAHRPGHRGSGED